MFKIQPFFDTISAYRILTDMRLPFEERQNSLILDHPKIPQAKIWFTDGAAVSDADMDNVFVAGSIYDLMALYLGPYEKVVDFMLEHYLAEATRQEGQTPEAFRDILADELRRDREIFDKWLGLRYSLRDQGEKFQESCMWLQRQGLGHNATNIIFAASGETLKNWLGNMDEFPALNPVSEFVVVPYFDNWHSLARIEMYNVQTDKPRIFELRQCPVSYCGLHTVRPSNIDIRTLGNLWDTLRHYANEHADGENRFGCVYPHFISSATGEPSMRLPRGTFIFNNGLELSRVAKCRNAFKKLYVFTNTRHRADPWLEFAIGYFKQAFEYDKGITPRVQRVLDDLTHDPEVHPTLVRWLRAQGQDRLAKLIDKHVARSQWTRNFYGEFQETEKGYRFRTGPDQTDALITNFIVRISHKTYYEATKESFMHGTLHMNGEEIPIVLDRPSQTNVNKFMISVDAVTQQHNRGKATLNPKIFPKEREPRDGVLLLIVDQHPPSLLGLNRLGWDDRRQIFETPVWHTTVAGLDGSRRLAHPNNQFYKDYYEFTPHNVGTNKELITTEVRSVIARVASMVVRQYFGKTMRAAPFSNDTNTENCLAAIFRALGQCKPIKLNTNDRRVNNPIPLEVQNYPVLGECEAGVQVDGFTGYIMALHPEGERVATPMTSEMVHQIYDHMTLLMQQLCLGLVRHGREMGEHLNPNPKRAYDYIQEGKKFIERLTKFKSYTVQPDNIPFTTMLLSQIPITQVNKFFVHDVKASIIRINFRQIRSVQRHQIQEELRDLTTAVNVQQHYLHVEATFMFGILDRYYEKPITLDVVMPPEVPVGTVVLVPPVAEEDSEAQSPTAAPADVRTPQTATGTSRVTTEYPPAES